MKKLAIIAFLMILFPPQAFSEEMKICDTRGAHKHGIMGKMKAGARLGVILENPSGEIKGALVKEVEEGSPADRAGIYEGDIITKFGDKEVSSMKDLIRLVRNSKPGDEIQLELMRNGKTEKISAILEETEMPMMGMGGMMNMEEMMERFSDEDPKIKAIMMQMKGEMMEAMGKIMKKYGKILENINKKRNR